MSTETLEYVTRVSTVAVTIIGAAIALIKVTGKALDGVSFTIKFRKDRK